MKAIDYEEESTKRGNWLDITGGAAKDSLTVLDYFAGKAMAALIAKVYLEEEADYRVELTEIAADAYMIANAMLRERNDLFTPQNVVKGVTGKTYG